MSDMKKRTACTKDTVNFVDTEASVRVSENGKTNLTEHNASKCSAVVGSFSLCSYFDFTSRLPANLIPVRENRINAYIQAQLAHNNVLVYFQDTFQWSSTDKKKSSSPVQAAGLLLMGRTSVSQSLLIEARSTTGIETHTASVGVWETFSSVARIS
jgi:hypothetical protein